MTISPPDADGDGVPDDADDEDDNDSQSDADEIVAGTDPLNPLSNVMPAGDIDADGLLNFADKDDDGDGFSDDLELAMNTLPTSDESTPFDGEPAGDPLPLTVSKLSIRLNIAAAGKDAITLQGTLPVPAGFSVTGAQTVVDVGGVVKVFTLDRRGSATSGADKFKLSVKSKRGAVAAQMAKFSARFASGNFAAEFEDEGLDGLSDLRAEPVEVPIAIMFNRRMFETTHAQLFSAKAGKSGRTK